MSKVQKLYCPECGNYLETSSGACADCSCGWKQEVEHCTDFEDDCGDESPRGCIPDCEDCDGWGCE